MKQVLALLFLAIVLGNIARVSLLGISVSFIDIALLVVSVYGGMLAYSRAQLFRYPVLVWSVLFFVYAIVSLGINTWMLPLSPGEFFKSLLYTLRFGVILWLPYCFLQMPAVYIRRMVIASAVTLGIFGIIQLFLVPDFSASGANMSALGWDPHQGRLLSTWFDPNYVGMAFVAGMMAVFPKLFSPGKSRNIAVGIILFLLFLIVLTYSRSALLGCVVACLVALLYTEKKWIGVLTLLFVFACIASPRFYDRMADGVYSGLTLFGLTETPPDPTSALRIRSWKAGVDIGNTSPVIGVGYNTLPIIQGRFWGDLTAHAASGIDASVLTVYATLGWVGIFFLVVYIASYVLLFLQKPKTMVSIAAFAFLSGVMIHALFVNSLFFSLMVPYIAWAQSELLSNRK